MHWAACELSCVDTFAFRKSICEPPCQLKNLQAPLVTALAQCGRQPQPPSPQNPCQLNGCISFMVIHDTPSMPNKSNCPARSPVCGQMSNIPLQHVHQLALSRYVAGAPT